MKIKPNNARGTRDFLPLEVARRNFLFQTIKNIFRKYGFQEIETPAMENLDTLTGKYGEEGDKLLFRILNSGDFLKELTDAELSARQLGPISRKLAEKGLRYDLTVPLARYVVQHQNELTFPFKRFHIGPVWRADRPQKGRYREFYQCDADIIGSDSILNEIELSMLYAEVFDQLGLKVQIQINHRSLLEGVAAYFGAEDRFESFIVSLDKLDKIGFDGVTKELIEKGFDFSQIPSANPIQYFLEHEIGSYSDWESLFAGFERIFKKINSEVGLKGLNELKQVCTRFSFRGQLILNPFLARGLSYYTGVVWEVISTEMSIGTIASGGRYANLTEMFGGKGMSGVGVSFGIERIYDIMNEMSLFPESVSHSVRVLVIHFDAQTEDYNWHLLQELRKAGISSEMYPSAAKLDKQFKYADARQIPYVVISGLEEMNQSRYKLKNMKSGEQQSCSLEEVLAVVQD